MVSHVLVFGVILGTIAAVNQTPLPFDGRWEYPHYLTFRPGNGQECQVNPPRFSWPYVPQTVMGRKNIPLREFHFQLSSNGDFSDPDMEIRTPYNFYNALPILEKKRWFWRVGYEVGTKQEQWSPVRSFTFAADAVEWDRTVINDAVRLLKGRNHPRMSPDDGDWEGWIRDLKSDELTASWLDSLLSRAPNVMKRSWWRDFPKTDVKGEAKYDDREFAKIAGDLTIASLAYRLTGNRDYLVAKDHALALARFPKGGLSSPEYHGAPRKQATQITEYLALCYDWLYDEMTEDERAVLLNCIDWRLRATYLEKASWRASEDIARQGVAVFSSSHPYENFMWCMPAVLLMVGDLPVADELTELCLNYLTGVTSAHGPDEGWNEGLAYGSWKGETMLHASFYTALLLPELNLGKNPFYKRLGEWYAHLMPLGIQRLAFGDYAATPNRHRGVQRNNARLIGWLSGDGRFVHRWEAIAKEIGKSPTNRVWIDLFFASRFALPSPVADKSTNAVFPEAGWVMVSTEPPSDPEAFDDAVGMIFKCRPRGGFSHSYRSENDFVWHAYGQTLSAGGGGTAYPDPHSRDSISHNVILIDGKGQDWPPWKPRYPFVGRLIAYHEGEDYIHWVGDATHAYQYIPGLLRWHRHVVFVAGKWFAVMDDLAMRPDADPARFSWLFHVAPKVPLTMEKDRAAFSYRMEDVHAQVAFANDPESVEIVNMEGREGFKNLITGEDFLAETVEKVESKGRELPEDEWMAHNIWVTNRQPAREWTLLTALTAWRDGESKPQVSFQGESAVTVSWADGTSQSVSFDPKIAADITADKNVVRAHALSTEPEILPPTGRSESVTLDGDTYNVEWLAHETFDDESWLFRWFAEGNSEVKVEDGKLWVRKLDPETANVATIWFRPELPDDAIVRFRTKAVPPEEKNAANLNLFLHARENDGGEVEFGRNGQYGEYHKFPNYIVTFVGGFRPGWSRARRDPGFNLLHESEVRSEIGQEYEIAVTIQGGRLRYYLDGKLIHDVQDPDPLPGGKFAIRTWSTNAWWDDVEFGRIK